MKYGVTADYVLALEVVTGTGELVRLGRKTAKGVAGYDLGSLIVGSEGTLGLVTEMTVRLRPVRPAERTVAGSSRRSSRPATQSPPSRGPVSSPPRSSWSTGTA